MKKIRIGNDIRVILSVTRAGMADDLRNKTLIVYIQNKHERFEVTDFVIDDNQIVFTWFGTQQPNKPGPYWITLYERNGLRQNVADTGLCFELVPHSWMENDDPTCSGFQSEEMHIGVNFGTCGDDPSQKDYDRMKHLPSINGVILRGELDSNDLGLQPAGDYVSEKDFHIFRHVQEDFERKKQKMLEDFKKNLELLQESITELEDSKGDKDKQQKLIEKVKELTASLENYQPRGDYASVAEVEAVKGMLGDYATVKALEQVKSLLDGYQEKGDYATAEALGAVKASLEGYATKLQIEALIAEYQKDVANMRREHSEDIERLKKDHEDTLPKINGVVVRGNMTLKDLGIQPEGNYQPAGDYAMRDFVAKWVERIKEISDSYVNSVELERLVKVVKEINKDYLTSDDYAKITKALKDYQPAGDYVSRQDFNSAIDTLKMMFGHRHHEHHHDEVSRSDFEALKGQVQEIAKTAESALQNEDLKKLRSRVKTLEETESQLPLTYMTKAEFKEWQEKTADFMKEHRPVPFSHEEIDILFS